MSTYLKVNGIGASKYKSAEFAALFLYFPGKNNAREVVYASLECEIHLVEGLRVNLLICNNILSPKNIVINIAKKTALIRSCKVTIEVNAKQQGQFFAKKLLSSQESVIPLCSEALVPLVRVLLPDNWDFLFYPTAQANLTLYTHIVDYKILRILVKNTFDQSLRVRCRHKLGHMLDIIYDNCFLINTQPAYDSTAVPPLSHFFSNLSTNPLILPIDSSMKTIFDNGKNVYGDVDAVRQISELVAEYPSIWESQSFVQIPPERWMKVPLKPSWESKVSSIKPRVYPLGNKAWRVIDNTFDKMHEQGRLKFTTDPTSFSFSVFIVWNADAQGKKKVRAVVDIQKLKKLVLPGSYPLLL